MEMKCVYYEVATKFLSSVWMSSMIFSNSSPVSLPNDLPFLKRVCGMASGHCLQTFKAGICFRSVSRYCSPLSFHSLLFFSCFKVLIRRVVLPDDLQLLFLHV
jgi:hypothetical protein